MDNKPVSESDTIRTAINQLCEIWKGVFEEFRQITAHFIEHIAPFCNNKEEAEAFFRHLTYAEYLKAWRKEKYLCRMANRRKRRKRRKPIHKKKNRRNRGA